MDDTYFDFKHNIESNEKLIQNRVDFLEIYVKKALEEYVKIDSRFEQLQTQYNTFINETSDFFDWYLSQNVFKKIWWNIRKLNYKQLKQIKNNNGSSIIVKQIVSLIYNENSREEEIFIHNMKGEVEDKFSLDHGYDLVIDIKRSEFTFIEKFIYSA